MSEGTIEVGTKVRVRTGSIGRPPVGIVTRLYVDGTFKVKLNDGSFYRADDSRITVVA